MSFDSRRKHLDAIEQIDFDVVVVGGGISGAVVFKRLVEKGYCVLLLEKGDFAGGTSQASSMMAWGNLIELRRLKLRQVGRGCAARENLIRTKSVWIAPRKFRYLPLKNGRKIHSASLAHCAYWLLGAGRRSLPRYRTDFAEAAFLKRENFAYSIEYEEAAIEPSDARFVLDWILSQSHSFEQTALNYCRLSGGHYDAGDERWHLEINDSIANRETIVKTKCVVNAAGVWTDDLNRQFGIVSPYRHVFGKGVFLGINRPPPHRSTLMIETREDEGCLSLIPWGPVALWGPTETLVKNLDEGFSVTPADARFLLDQLNRHLSDSVSTKDIISLRCGVRPLPVKCASVVPDNILDIPREYRVCVDLELPWISVHGGKITICRTAANRVESLLKKFLPPPILAPQVFSSFEARPEMENFPSLIEKIPSARWCAEKEMCWNLEDYLRRRTNVAQWIARGGLGLQNENLPHLKNLAKNFCDDDEIRAEAAVNAYQRKIKREFDDVLTKAAELC